MQETRGRGEMVKRVVQITLNNSLHAVSYLTSSLPFASLLTAAAYGPPL